MRPYGSERFSRATGENATQTAQINATSAQNSYLIAAVIGSAVLPTLVANAFFMPRYLLPKTQAPPAESALGTMAIGEWEGR